MSAFDPYRGGTLAPNGLPGDVRPITTEMAFALRFAANRRAEALILMHGYYDSGDISSLKNFAAMLKTRLEKTATEGVSAS